MIPSPGRKNIRKFWSLDRQKSSDDLLFLKYKRGAVFVLAIQLFQLRLSDHFKLTRQDRRVVWVVANTYCLSFTVVSSWSGTSDFLVQIIDGHHPDYCLRKSWFGFSFSIISTCYDVRKFMFHFLHVAVFPTSNLHTNARAPRVPI